MCYVQIAGMLVATLVTLVIVPVLYVVFVEDLHLVRWETGASTEHDQAHELNERINGHSSGVALTHGALVQE
jgi:hypothetical protein